MNNINIEKYKDIINLPHHVSKKHPQMSLYERSAQFAPFAALTGYEDEVEETARLTSMKIDIDDEVKNELNRKLNIIKNKIYTRPQIKLTYFIPDLKKEGGKYETVNGVIKKIDEYNNYIILQNNATIKISDILDIEGINIKL